MEKDSTMPAAFAKRVGIYLELKEMGLSLEEITFLWNEAVFWVLEED